jgi:hypothetical protein
MVGGWLQAEKLKADHVAELERRRLAAKKQLEEEQKQWDLRFMQWAAEDNARLQRLHERQVAAEAAWQKEDNLRRLRELEKESLKQRTSTVEAFSRAELLHREALDDRLRLDAEIEELKVSL